MTTTAGLTVAEKKEIRRVDPQALLEQAISKDASVETLERLFSLAAAVRAEQAKQAWNRAMVEFQKRCPKILKSTEGAVAGKFKYRFAPLDEILAVVRPIMTDLELTVSWRQRAEPGKVIVSCRIAHVLGHYEDSGEIAMPVGEDRSGASAAQRVGIAHTYGRRYSFNSIAGIAPEDDPDAPETEAATTPAPSGQQAPPSQKHKVTDVDAADTDNCISEAQHKRMWAIAFKTAKQHGGDAKELMNAALRRRDYGSSKDVRTSDYNDICTDLEVPF